MTERKLPDELKYNDDYSWVKIDGDTAKVGVIAPAAKRVKKFVFIDLPEEGEEIEKGENYVSLEAVKWSGHLSSPVSGRIVEVNKELFDEPSRINEDPYGSWVMKVKLDDEEQTSKLMSTEEAKEFYEEKID